MFSNNSQISRPKSGEDFRLFFTLASFHKELKLIRWLTDTTLLLATHVVKNERTRPKLSTCPNITEEAVLDQTLHDIEISLIITHFEKFSLQFLSVLSVNA